MKFIKHIPLVLIIAQLIKTFVVNPTPVDIGVIGVLAVVYIAARASELIKHITDNILLFRKSNSVICIFLLIIINKNGLSSAAGTCFQTAYIIIFYLYCGVFNPIFFFKN